MQELPRRPHPADELGVLVEMLDTVRADEEMLHLLGLDSEAARLAQFERLVHRLIARTLEEFP